MSSIASSGRTQLSSSSLGSHQSISRPVQLTVKACPAFHSMGKRNYRDLSITFWPGAIARGTFGVLFRAELSGTGEQVAVKKVLQDPRYKNRELQILYKLGWHSNIVKLKYHYLSHGSRGHSEIYLHLVMELMPESLTDLLVRNTRRGSLLSLLHIKAYMYQLLRAVNYMHSHNVCHRDIKSQNVLVSEMTLQLRLCDMGSAKDMGSSSSNVAYISSRYYRAPELLFGSTHYSCSIDLWSSGCVLSEMTIGHCLFMANTSLDQLVAIIRVLGTPTAEDVTAMNPQYSRFTFPEIAPDPHLNIPADTPADLLDLMCQLLTYQPQQRVPPLKALTHPFFDELRQQEMQKQLAQSADMPELFNFSSQELSSDPQLEEQLMPAKQNQQQQQQEEEHQQQQQQQQTSTNSLEKSGETSEVESGTDG